MSATEMNRLKTNKINADIARLMAETQRLSAETAKLNREPMGTYRLTRAIFWYPMAIACGIVFGVATVTVLIVKALGM